MTGSDRWIAALTSRFEERDADLVAGDPLGFPGYRQALEGARRESGLLESCRWGWAEVGGVRCALVVFDFAFLGGSMGLACGEKVARAFEEAQRERCPVVTVVASGGARLQEGMAALIQMTKTVEARRRHRFGHVSVLLSPTTGGVYASFASLGDVLVAAQGAMLAFAGPRAAAELTGNPGPPEAATAAFALEHGLVDAVAAADAIPDLVARALRNLAKVPKIPQGRAAHVRPPRPRRPPPPWPPAEVTAWDRLQAARDPLRAKAPRLLDALLDDQLELRGDRAGTDDPAVTVRLGALRSTGRRILGIGSVGGRRIGPGGFRKVTRALDVAGRLDLPVLALVDTAGADPLPASEGGGVAHALARSLEAMLDCPSPTLALLLGEGGSGGGLALAAADRVLCLENAVFSVIAPEAAAAILHRDPARAPELAEALGITASDLLRLGIASAVVPERAGTPLDEDEELAGLLGAEIDALARRGRAARLARRRRLWRSLLGEHLGREPR